MRRKPGKIIGWRKAGLGRRDGLSRGRAKRRVAGQGGQRGRSLSGRDRVESWGRVTGEGGGGGSGNRDRYREGWRGGA